VPSGLAASRRRLSDYVAETVNRWRGGGNDGQRIAVGLLIAAAGGILVVSVINERWAPPSAYFLPLLAGSLLLRFTQLVALSVLTLVMASLTLVLNGDSLLDARIAILVVAIGIILFQAAQFHSGLPGAMSGAMLTDLRKKLHSQGRIGDLPAGWRGQSELATSGGVKFAGDFVVSTISSDSSQFEVVLVDVSGKGVQVATAALQFAGALGGLIGSLPPLGLFAAANDFLLRQGWPEGFATAVHVAVDLRTGDYSVINAGHPPAMRWRAQAGAWELDAARGMALGVSERIEFTATSGRLEVGDALLLYTDGMVEVPGQDLTEGINWLRMEATRMASQGFTGGAARLIATAVGRNDDRAVVLLDRRGIGMLGADRPVVTAGA
jgi:hypothetical protein